MDIKPNAVKAVTALLENQDMKHSNQLFAEDELFEVVVALTEETVLPKIPTFVSLPVKHSIYPSDCEICLFTLPPQRHYKDMTANLPHIRKVVDIEKLRKKYTEQKQRNVLYKSFHLFLADRRLYAKLPRLLGKQFMSRRTPIPIPLSLTETKEEFAKKIKYFLRHTPARLCDRSRTLKFKVGRTCQTAEEVAENIEAAMLKLISISRLPEHWKHIKSIQVKLPSSPALRLYARPIKPLIIIPSKKAGERPNKNDKSKKSKKTLKKKPLVKPNEKKETAKKRTQ